MHAQLVEASVPYASGGFDRTPGVHVSGLIRKMAAQYGILKKKWIPDPEDIHLVEVEGDGAKWWDTLDEDSKTRMAVGMAWEQWYLPQLPHVVYQPGEMCVEGVYMTIDGKSLEDNDRDVIVVERGLYAPRRHSRPRHRYALAVHEIKTTSKSINTVGDLSDPIANWLWLTQTKAYCKAVGCTVCYLHVLFLYGDYSYPIRPKLRLWRIQFTQDEIEATWQSIREFLQDQRALGHA